MTYGWVYFTLAVVLIGCSFGVLTGSQFSRWIGMFAGGLLTISAVWWMPYYPIWSMTYVAVGMLIIYGLAVYGGRDDADDARYDGRTSTDARAT